MGDVTEKSAVSKNDLLPFLGIIGLLLVIYHPLFFGKPVLPDTWLRFEPWAIENNHTSLNNANNDAILLYIPWNKFTHDELNAGRLPEWDPYCLNGVPLLTNHLVPVYNPVYYFSAKFFSPLQIMGASGFFHTLFLTLFFYLFLREWTGNRKAALLTACLLPLSMIPNPHYQPWPMTLAFFPAIWFFHERWLKHRSPWAGLWIALCWYIPMVSGYPSLFMQLSLFTLVWFLIRPGKEIPVVSRVGMFFLPFILGVGLSMVQNYPTLLASMDSDRSIFKSVEDLRREYAFSFNPNEPWQTHVKRLIQPAIPFKFSGNDFFNRGYVGLLPVMLAIFSLWFFKRDKYPKRVLYFALIVLPFALVPELNFGVYFISRGILIDPNPPIEVFGFLILMLCATGAGFCLTYSAKYKNQIVILLSIGFILSAYFQSENIFPNSADNPLPETTEISTLKSLQHKNWGRLIRYSKEPFNVMQIKGQPYTFYPNLGTYFEIPDAFGYYNLAPKSRFDYLRDIQSDAVIENRGIVAFTGNTDPFDPRLSWIGARYILTPDRLENVEPVFSSERFNIYENEDAMPRAFSMLANDLEKKTMKSAIMELDEPGHAIIQIPENSVGHLYFNEGFSKGWSAKTGRGETRISEFNGLMRVPVDEGEQTVDFYYRTPGLSQGILASSISFFLWILAALSFTLKRKEIKPIATP